MLTKEDKKFVSIIVSVLIITIIAVINVNSKDSSIQAQSVDYNQESNSDYTQIIQNFDEVENVDVVDFELDSAKSDPVFDLDEKTMVLLYDDIPVIDFSLRKWSQGRKSSKNDESISEESSVETYSEPVRESVTEYNPPAIDYSSGYGFAYLDIPLSYDLQEYIWNTCQSYGADYYLVIAIIEHESGFRSDVISSTNDYGLMQINKINHEYLSNILGVTDFLDPYQNVKCGIYFIGMFTSKYGNFHQALMAYQFGEGGASSKWKQGVYTSSYSEWTVSRREYYIKMSGQ